MTKSIKGSIFGGALLVAGTSIGGGMLALPILTSLGGFLPSLVIYLLCWLFMACTGLLLLEACLWMKGESNLVTMAQNTLGWPGKMMAWGLYLFLFYSLTVAYVVGCGNVIYELLNESIPEWMGFLLFIVIFGPILFAGAAAVGRLNIYLMIALFAGYFGFVFLGAPYVRTELLKETHWSLALIGLPIAFTSFAYQGIIPTLASYMHYDAKRMRTVILIGSFIPFIAYTIWQWLIMGIIPRNGPGGLIDALEHGRNAVDPLKAILNNPTVYYVGEFFAFFAMLTSFYGVTLGLIDFLADGLGIQKTAKGKALLCLMVLIPPLVIAFYYPNCFLMALDYAGGFGCALLLGLLPILMVWAGRYWHGFKSDYQLPGGRLMLVVLLGFVLMELVCQFFIVFKGFE